MAGLKGKRVCDEVPDHGDKEPEAPGIHHEQEQLASEHAAPCTEDIGGALGSTGGKRHRRRENQHADHDVPLRCFEQQFDVVPGHDDREDQDDQGHRSRCQAADNDRQHARKIRKLDRRKRSVNDPSVRRAGKLEDECQDLVRKIGQEQKEDRPKEQFTGVLRTEADTCAIVLEQLPDQVEQYEPNSNRHEDVVHRLRSREIPKEYGHRAPVRYCRPVPFSASAQSRR